MEGRAPGKDGKGGGSWRQLITSFYAIYNPAKVKDVDDILAEYAGHEMQLYKNLVAKYNAPLTLLDIDPTPHYDSPQSQSPAEPAREAPGLLPTFRMKRRVRTPSISSSKTPEAKREQQQPATVLSDGLQRRVEQVLRSSPLMPEGDAAVKAAVEKRAWRNAIIQLYQKYNPAKIAHIHDILQEYDGEEEALYELLEAKYKGGVGGKADATTSPTLTPCQSVGVQCAMNREAVVPHTPLTDSLELTAGKVVATDDIPDQMEWSLLVMLEQEERLRELSNALLLQNGKQEMELYVRAMEGLERIHREATSLRLLFDAHCNGGVPESLFHAMPDRGNVSLPVPPRLDQNENGRVGLAAPGQPAQDNQLTIHFSIDGEHVTTASIPVPPELAEHLAQAEAAQAQPQPPIRTPAAPNPSLTRSSSPHQARALETTSPRRPLVSPLPPVAMDIGSLLKSPANLLALLRNHQRSSLTSLPDPYNIQTSPPSPEFHDDCPPRPVTPTSL